MSWEKLLLRNLRYHWRGNLAVFLGIALGGAVLTGALFVGDSLRGSLKALTLDQLGWVEEAMLPGRFFRAELAKGIAADGQARCEPILMLQGSATGRADEPAAVRAGKVAVLGVDASFWPAEQVPEGRAFWESSAAEVVLNRTLAAALDAKVGDTVTLHLQKQSSIPREMLLGERKIEEVAQPVRVKVRGIVPEDGMGRFSLRPTPEPVRNAFVPMRFLQKKLDLAGRANALLAAAPKSDGLAADHMRPAVEKHLTLEDWNLRWRSPRDRADGLIRYLDPQDADGGDLKRLRWSVRVPDAELPAAEKNGEKLIPEQKGGRTLFWRSRVPSELAEAANANNGILTRDMVIAFYEKHRNYYLLESGRMVLDPTIVKTVRELEEHRTDAFAEISVYLADSITFGSPATPTSISVPYAIVAAVDTRRGPVVGPDVNLKDNEIALLNWPGSPLPVKPGGAVVLTIFTPSEKNTLQSRLWNFKVKARPPLTGNLNDPDLTPEFPGVTDRLDMADWTNPPFPFDKKRVKKADEDFWQSYRTTPRAYISVAAAKKAWDTRFGFVTSIRVAKDGASDPATLPTKLLAALKPAAGGFVFQDIRAQALRASAGSSDFGELFIYFSFFLIVSALLLVGLLVRLNIERRASEIGLFLAVGWDHGKVRRLLLAEGAILALAGSALGLAGALVYGDLMLKMLAANWPGGAGLNFLTLHTSPASFAIGFAAALFVSLATLYFATRGLAKLSPRSLLSGQTSASVGLGETKPGWSRWLIPAGVIGALGLVMAGAAAPAGMAQAGYFFGSGALLLTAALAGVWIGLRSTGHASSPQPSLTSLGIRNAGRNAIRSLLTVGLLAAASFLIVAVESFHKGTGHEFLEKTGGSGGFALYAQGNAPVFEDLGDARVRVGLGLDTPELRTVRFYPCRLQPGDDASCLNLYKPLKPRLLAFSKTLIERGGFDFAGSLAATDAEKKNPWLLLDGDTSGGVPAIIDANTAEWILKVGKGDTIEVHDGEGQPVKLRIVGLLHESMFQSEILISEANFLKMYPRQEGFSFFLIDSGPTEPGQSAAIERQLGNGLAAAGLDVATTASRLDGYLAVENTYLQTFQALGALGLLLGAAGLAIVLLRGVWERRAELALFLALGFNGTQLAWLVLAENAFLLALGLAAGTLSALLAVAPHLVGFGAQVLWLHIALLLAAVLAVGMIAAALAVWSTLRTPILTALRRE